MNKKLNLQWNNYQHENAGIRYIYLPVRELDFVIVTRISDRLENCKLVYAPADFREMIAEDTHEKKYF